MIAKYWIWSRISIVGDHSNLDNVSSQVLLEVDLELQCPWKVNFPVALWQDDNRSVFDDKIRIGRGQKSKPKITRYWNIVHLISCLLSSIWIHFLRIFWPFDTLFVVVVWSIIWKDFVAVQFHYMYRLSFKEHSCLSTIFEA